MGVFRSIVLLTKTLPSLHVGYVQSNLEAHGFVFSGADDAENFIVGEDEIFIVKLAGENLFMIRLLTGSYWGMESFESFAATPEVQDNPALRESMKAAEGAILIDPHLVDNGPSTALYLSKLAAALMTSETSVMLVPPSWKASPVTAQLQSALMSAGTAADLVPHLLNVHIAAGTGDSFWCFVLGMHLFDLPDLGTHCTADDLETTQAVLQSHAMYVVQRGEAVPVGDTFTVPGMGDYRVTEPDFDPSPHAAFGAVGIRRADA